ncbi:MAG TPA: cytochrome c [Terriglobales bacterium]|nr:cytochrome c [Terriglobales bacterium]
MFWVVKHGVRYTGMGAWEGEMSEVNIWKVVTFLSYLEKLPPEVEKEWAGSR